MSPRPVILNACEESVRDHFLYRVVVETPTSRFSNAPRSDRYSIASCHSEEAAGRRENLDCGRLFPLSGGALRLPRRAYALLGVTWLGIVLCHCEPSITRRGNLGWGQCTLSTGLFYPNQILRFTQNDISIGLVSPRFLIYVWNDIP